MSATHSYIARCPPCPGTGDSAHSLTPVAVEPTESVLAMVRAGEVDVVLIGAESVDPETHAATVSAGCKEACEMAALAIASEGEGRGRVRVVVVCAGWGAAPPGAVELAKEHQQIVAGLPPRPNTADKPT